MTTILASALAAYSAGVLTLEGSGPPLSLSLMMGLTCCAVGLVICVLVLGSVLAIKQGRAAKGDPNRASRKK